MFLSDKLLALRVDMRLVIVDVRTKPLPNPLSPETANLCRMIQNFLFTVIRAVATSNSALELPLTAENVESVLDEVRPYLIADGGNVALHEIDGNVVRLKLQGACGSCPSSVTTMKMGIERRLMEKIPEIVAVEPIADEETGLELNEDNIEKVNQCSLSITRIHSMI